MSYFGHIMITSGLLSFSVQKLWLRQFLSFFWQGRMEGTLYHITAGLSLYSLPQFLGLYDIASYAVSRFFIGRSEGGRGLLVLLTPPERNGRSHCSINLNMT